MNFIINVINAIQKKLNFQTILNIVKIVYLMIFGVIKKRNITMSKTTTVLTKTKGDLSDDKFCRQYWNEKGQHILEGAKILKVEYMTKKETEEMYWDNSPISMLLMKDNKKFWVYPSSDDEGNDGGALFMCRKDESCMPVLGG